MSWVVDSELAEESLMPFVLLLIGFLSATASAQQQWFDRHSEGWFWYEHIAEPETDENKINDQNERHQPLTTAWIRDNIGQYLDKAIDLPSKENVSNYLYLDRLIKEKAERFAYVGKQVIEGDPMLDENVRRPISPAAAKIKDDTAYKAREIILKKIARIAGLVFYYQGSCRLCHIQARTVQLLSMEYGFELIPISTDGQLIPELQNSRTERSPPASLNIVTYPALFLMQPPDNIVLIRQGSTSLTALAERLVDVAYQQGWINKGEYQKTRISNDTWNEGLPPEIINLFSKPPSSSHQ
ncbi:conjugal transfer protein TraF [Endozoicomonas numazuensis]|uniref:conjugal transfer protein TraF n=1 Tax=Endozoicomonas numazuensis TaxID=1137799 RepID=UPI001377B3C8|nr:conjugal transfer protein TraF [Endozoicomonas numazuensis]